MFRRAVVSLAYPVALFGRRSATTVFKSNMPKVASSRSARSSTRSSPATSKPSSASKQSASNRSAVSDTPRNGSASKKDNGREIMRARALELGATDLVRSDKTHKKWAVLYEDQWLHFGDKRYEDFTMHNDPKRRENYLKRARGIRDKHGNLTCDNPNMANFWAIRLLW